MDWFLYDRDRRDERVKVHESRYNQFGAIHTFFTRQNLLKKILKKDKY